MAHIVIEGVENVRDLGGIPVFDNRQVKCGLFYRGANLSAITPYGAHVFAQELGISMVIDLRVGWETEEKPDVVIPGVSYCHIPFYDKEKVGIDYTEKATGTQLVGRDIACDPDHFYRHMPNELTAAQTGKVVRLMMERALEGKATYVHCSGGKDRAGIAAFCLLTVLGASDRDILDDYLLTNVSRDAHIDGIYQRFLRLSGGDERRAWEITNAHAARAENLEAYRNSVIQRYGSMDSFIEKQLGLGFDFCAFAREKLTEPCCTPSW